MIAERPAGVSAQAWAALFGPPIAHRGLWAPGGAPENTLAAFAAAAEAGYGMELDVQLSADGEAMVFHDATLERMTTARGRVADHTAEQLGELELAGTAETIPTLAQTLTYVAGRSLVLVELKTAPGEAGPLEARVAEILAGYDGPAGVLAFEGSALAWFAENAAHVMRGLNWAPDHRDASGIKHLHFFSLSVGALADLRGPKMPVVCWTLRHQSDWPTLRNFCDNYIFEGFRPEARAA
jgi:glycerophosphoryl diester phosphodiesterase